MFNYFLNLQSDFPINSNLDHLLDNPETNLQTILRQDNINSTILSKNQKLINFFDDSKIKAMLDYILVE